MIDFLLTDNKTHFIVLILYFILINCQQQHVHVHILPRRARDYEENDAIYEDLKNHDKGPNVDWRTDDDMKQEASKLRDFFKTLSN